MNHFATGASGTTVFLSELRRVASHTFFPIMVRDLGMMAFMAAVAACYLALVTCDAIGVIMVWISSCVALFAPQAIADLMAAAT